MFSSLAVKSVLVVTLSLGSLMPVPAAPGTAPVTAGTMDTTGNICNMFPPNPFCNRN